MADLVVRRERLQHILMVIEPLMLIIAPAVLVFCAIKKIENPVLLTTAIAIMTFIPFVFRFELKRPKPADIMPIAVLSAAAIVGRIAFVAIPNVQPVSAIVIFTGIWFGRQSGYLTGAFTALVSNMALGQGMWTPWQMYAWGLMGYLAGVLFERAADDGFRRKTQRIGVYVFGGFSAALFSIIMDVWFIIGFLTDLSYKSMLAAFGAGLSLNSLHIVATVIFLVLMLKPWGKKIRRIKQKYNKTATDTL
ncbi:MAG: ECF transporter S component [Clostridiales Family XIII bacterium]|jgi:energy-coupling factor transport system substrate-specific component|nr:ECF transporter S component [Clostridiales Family XIII bacterium]